MTVFGCRNKGSPPQRLAIDRARSVGSAEPPAIRGYLERSTGLMGGTVALVSREGYFGITGLFGITSSDCGYLNVSVPHLQTPVRAWSGTVCGGRRRCRWP